MAYTHTPILLPNLACMLYYVRLHICSLISPLTYMFPHITPTSHPHIYVTSQPPPPLYILRPLKLLHTLSLGASPPPPRHPCCSLFSPPLCVLWVLRDARCSRKKLS